MDPRKIILSYAGFPENIKTTNECAKKIELNGKCDHCGKVGDLKRFPFDNGFYFDIYHDRYRFFCSNCGKIHAFDLAGYDPTLIDVYVQINRFYI